MTQQRFVTTSRHTLETMLTLSAEIARRTAIEPIEEIPKAIAKLQRLERSLCKRYAEEKELDPRYVPILQTYELEQKAQALARTLGAELTIYRDLYRPFGIKFNGVERWL